MESTQGVSDTYFSSPLTILISCTGIHKEIAGLNQVDDLKASDIRLFCDNDKRWGKQRSTGGWYDEKK